MPLFLRALLIGSLCMFFSGVAEAADAPVTETPQPPLATNADAPPVSSPTDIEQAIAQLLPPVDQVQVKRLTAAIQDLDDPTEQERLQQMLEARVNTVATWITPDASDEIITQRLDALKFTAGASTESRNASEEVWSAISRIPDPERRERFLHQLEERERQAGTLIEAPKSSSQ